MQIISHFLLLFSFNLSYRKRRCAVFVTQCTPEIPLSIEVGDTPKYPKTREADPRVWSYLAGFKIYL